MYQLWSGGAPFTVEGDGTKRLRDKSGTTVRLLGIAGRVLQELKTDQKWKDTKVAWVSCTDEPTWAAECLEKFKVEDGRSLNQLVDSVQIFKGIIIIIITIIIIIIIIITKQISKDISKI